jgi:glycosyltransferase involved in cell wall biosynthesis
MNPTIPLSILMPVFNAEKYVREAVESILGQRFSDFELIVVDDGSTDGSGDILRSFTDPRIRRLDNGRNLGLVPSLNRGIEACRGRYIARMDADDVSLPDRLERQFRFLEAHPSIGVCGSWAQVIDEDSRMVGRIVRPTDPVDVRMHLLFSVPLVHPSCCIRAELLRGYLYRDVPAAEDYDLWSRMNDGVRMANLPAVLLQYRWHEANVSKAKRAIQDGHKQEIIRRELQRLNLSPTDEQMRIHRLSFSLHGFNRKAGLTALSTADLEASRQWLAGLMEANERVKRYPAHAFRAFLWSRWVVLCLSMHRKAKIFHPSFASLHPRTLYDWGRQMALLLAQAEYRGFRSRFRDGVF